MGELWPITIPEQVVGSSHEFEFPAPRNLSTLNASGTMMIEGSAEIRANWGSPLPFPGMGSGPIRLTYAPTSPGEKHATLALVMRWEDGHTERHTIQVSARARKLESVPGDAPAKATTTASMPVQPDESPNAYVTKRVMKGWLNADVAFADLMDEQNSGVNLVEKEAAKFRPKPAERELWQDLADIAFQLGTGAVAGLLSRFISSKVSDVIVRASHAADEAGKATVAITDAEKSAIAARGDVVAEREANQHVVATKVGSYATADRARHAKFAQGEIGSAIGMAVSTTVTKTANEIRGPQPGSASAASLDGEIAFFSDQSSMIKALKREGGPQLNEQLSSLLDAHPDIATDLMTGVRLGFDAASVEAKEKQAAITSAQYMTYLARTELGTEKVKTMNGDHVATDMSEQRNGSSKSKLEAAPLASGVLELVCDYQPGGAVKVVDARAHNVSYLVVNRLRDKPLANSGIPMRVSLRGDGTILTRDEVGRVRFSGGLLDLTAPHTEEQQIQEAERIFAVAMSKTIADWGVPQIHTNDAGQGPDQPKGTTVK
ncbi:MAG: hypothetical protein QM831_43925 [Kofleriaceae bacterium]